MNPNARRGKVAGIVFFAEYAPGAHQDALGLCRGGFRALCAAKEERTVMAKLLLGKPVIDSLREELRGRIAALEERGVKPGLAIVRVGARPDDLAYERTALKRAAGLGIRARTITLPENASQEELMDVIAWVNSDPSIHGCLMFRPLPGQFDEEAVCDALDPRMMWTALVAAPWLRCLQAEAPDMPPARRRPASKCSTRTIFPLRASA